MSHQVYTPMTFATNKIDDSTQLIYMTLLYTMTVAAVSFGALSYTYMYKSEPLAIICTFGPFIIDKHLSFSLKTYKYCENFTSIAVSDDMSGYLFLETDGVRQARNFLRTTGYSQSQIEGKNDWRGCSPLKDRDEQNRWFHPCGSAIIGPLKKSVKVSISSQQADGTIEKLSPGNDYPLAEIGVLPIKDPSTFDTDHYNYWVHANFTNKLLDPRFIQSQPRRGYPYGFIASFSQNKNLSAPLRFYFDFPVGEELLVAQIKLALNGVQPDIWNSHCTNISILNLSLTSAVIFIYYIYRLIPKIGRQRNIIRRLAGLKRDTL